MFSRKQNKHTQKDSAELSLEAKNYKTSQSMGNMYRNSQK